MSSGVYQRGEEDEGVHGFLVEDIKQEIRRSSRLKCSLCKRKGASVGCSIKSCRKMVHLPCGIKGEFIFQFTGLFPSFCRKHRPTQTLTLSSRISPPGSCSVCLDRIEPVLSYSVLKCPCCHSGWFHRDCIQRQAHSAAMFFFRCTLCSNKDLFQQEMLRLGIHIPERDASWELEENAYEELLQVYQRCDALKCHCSSGRNYSSQEGWHIVRCTLCGSRGTHRKCSSLRFNSSWTCEDCRHALSGDGPLQRHRQSSRSCTLKRSVQPWKRCSVQGSSPGEILRRLARQISQVQSVAVVVKRGSVLEAALEVLRRPDFTPRHALAVCFTGSNTQQEGVSRGNLRQFLGLLLKELQNSALFEGAEDCKNLALDPRAVQDDLYFDAGCLLALSLVHGGPPVSFFSRALYHCLFGFPRDSPLTLQDMSDTLLAAKVKAIQDAESVDELKEAVLSASDYLDVAGCLRPVSSLSERDTLVNDMVNFHLITRIHLPLQRFREGLKTLGVFDEIQTHPEAFSSVFCCPPCRLSAGGMADLFTVHFSDIEEQKTKEMAALGFWRQYLHECEDGRCATSLEEVLIFTTSMEVEPVMGFNPAPSISFVHPEDSMGMFPESQPSLNHLVLPVLPSYELFKRHMEYTICQLTVMQAL
ncbi:G2/M phase-specific E3 ubiquitin-protein ligase [Megalops cyprinoides]|uniref:G2/M phase-specific E3 ubiquitin-protein ligase n=1 Tax=Megalops cyprinoides TaxID=118141 RepID=UPI0018648672|nr:G2/M phase-specific E3 ubiquitin-protein ligase [Megalops cyprinoides]